MNFFDAANPTQTWDCNAGGKVPQPPSDPRDIVPTVLPQYAALPVLGNLKFEEIQCQIEPGVDARVYTQFNATLLAEEIAATFVVHIAALRDLIAITLYTIGGFIAFYLVLNIIGALVWALLKAMGAIRVNRRGWYKILPRAGGKLKEEHLDGRDWAFLTRLREGPLKQHVGTVIAMARLVRIDVSDFLDSENAKQAQASDRSDNNDHDDDDDNARHSDSDNDNAGAAPPDGVSLKAGKRWRGKHTHVSKAVLDTKMVKFKRGDHTACDYAMATAEPLPKVVSKSAKELACEAERFAEWLTDSMSAFGPKATILELAQGARKRPRTWSSKNAGVVLTDPKGPQTTRDNVLRLLRAARGLKSATLDTVLDDIDAVREACINVCGAAQDHHEKMVLRMKSSRLLLEQSPSS